MKFEQEVLTIESETDFAYITWDIRNKVNEIVIGKGIKVIPKESLKNCPGLKQVNLTDVTDIGDFVFFNCTKLKEVKSSKIKTIGREAFLNCKSLKEVNKPDIIEDAFKGCDNLMLN